MNVHECSEFTQVYKGKRELTVHQYEWTSSEYECTRLYMSEYEYTKLT